MLFSEKLLCEAVCCSCSREILPYRMHSKFGAIFGADVYGEHSVLVQHVASSLAAAAIAAITTTMCALGEEPNRAISCSNGDLPMPASIQFRSAVDGVATT